LNFICLPALLFGAEAAINDKAETTKLCNAYNRAWAKIFSTYDSNKIKWCQYFSGYIPLELAIEQRMILFAFSILKHTDLTSVCFKTEKANKIFLWSIANSSESNIFMFWCQHVYLGGVKKINFDNYF